MRGMSEACFGEDGLALLRESALHSQGLPLVSRERREGNRGSRAFASGR